MTSSNRPYRHAFALSILITFALSTFPIPLLAQEGQDDPRFPLTVSLSTNSTDKTYREDDTLRATVKTNLDCYIRLIYSDAAGHDIVIFPNYQDRNDKVRADTDYLVPTQFGITPPFGQERLHVFVSTEKFPDVRSSDRGDGLHVLQEPIEDIIKRFRQNGNLGDYAERSIDIVTRAKESSPHAPPSPATTKPIIQLLKPASSDYVIETGDHVEIQGIIRSAKGPLSVAVNNLPAQLKTSDSGSVFSAKVRVNKGENKFTIQLRRRDEVLDTRILTIRKTEHKFASQRWAVVIGISDYAHPEITDLKFAHRDAEGFHRFLKSANGGAFADDHIIFLQNAQGSKEAIRDAIFQFLGQSRKEDLVVIFFAGHALSTGSDFSYFITHDTDPYRLEETAFDMQEIGLALDKTIKAGRVILFADACYSGAVNDYLKGRRTTALEQNLINRYLVEMAKARPGIVSLTSSAENEVSGESWIFWEHGVFTFVLLSGLGAEVTNTQGDIKPHENGDKNGDGIVTIGELIDYVNMYVRGYTKNQQNPQINQTGFDFNTPLSVIR